MDSYEDELDLVSAYILLRARERTYKAFSRLLTLRFSCLVIFAGLKFYALVGGAAKGK